MSTIALPSFVHQPSSLRIMHRIGATPRPYEEPRIAWFDAHHPYRPQPRGPNGRFMSKAWLADAELFLPADRAFFRSPLSTEVK